MDWKQLKKTTKKQNELFDKRQYCWQFYSKEIRLSHSVTKNNFYNIHTFKKLRMPFFLNGTERERERIAKHLSHTHKNDEI